MDETEINFILKYSSQTIIEGLKTHLEQVKLNSQHDASNSLFYRWKDWQIDQFKNAHLFKSFEQEYMNVRLSDPLQHHPLFTDTLLDSIHEVQRSVLILREMPTDPIDPTKEEKDAIDHMVNLIHKKYFSDEPPTKN